MALKLLQPGLRPMGQFDVEDDDKASVTGGEIMTLAAIGSNSDYYAADVEGMGEGLFSNLASTGSTIVPIFLADEGISGYGTAFGELIGSTVGQATSQSGATVIGPHTASGSGKVTLWHAPGLYAVTSPSTRNSGVGGSTDCWKNGESVTALSANGALHSDSGKLTATSGGSEQVAAFYLGGLGDTSLVSTTTSAATGSAQSAEEEVIYFLGTSAVVS